ncbi:UvrD-helicase domain-containing protein [Pseudomonas syringae]|uniref:UvrD-helicase domain-containing protein n=1 Tax=Pseudomonas syringae TaxID=317 RepID=UPI0003629DF9|nr:UvrD-helicase domain-containing protein [Pseudomonas syringae]
MTRIKRTPTLEQAVALNSTASKLLLRARAGTGKTTLLELKAEQNPGLRILYLTFGQENQKNAASRFPSNVVCKTTHSAAWEIGGQFKKACKQGDLTPNILKDAYDIPLVFARQLLTTLENYMRSDDVTLQARHLPPTIPHTEHAKAISWGQLVWKDLGRLRFWRPGCDEPKAVRDEFLANTPLRIPHDGYLKLWCLTNPDLSLGFDLILLDEYQDNNPAVAGVVKRQSCNVIQAGDQYQGIFGFRGAWEAPSAGDFDQVVTITESYRFGPVVAGLATMLLKTFCNEPEPVRSMHPALSTHFSVDRTKPYAIVGRTNAKLFANAVALLGKQRMHFVGGIENYPFDKLVDVHHLMAGQHGQVRDTLLKSFSGLAGLEAYANDTDDKEIHSLIGVAKQYGDQVPHLVERIKTEAVDIQDQAQVMLMTAHRSKGLEFPQVILLDDFQDLITDSGAQLLLDTPQLRQELHLLYVGLTRTRGNLELNAQLKAVIAHLVGLGEVGPDVLEAWKATSQGRGVGTSGAGFTPSIGGGASFAGGEVGTGAGHDVNVAQLVTGDTAYLARDVEEVESAIELAILRRGLLSPAALAEDFGCSPLLMADTLASMILAGRLSSVLFQDSSVIRDRLVIGSHALAA